jgi:hypothetical protein
MNAFGAVRLGLVAIMTLVSQPAWPSEIRIRLQGATDDIKSIMIFDDEDREFDLFDDGQAKDLTLEGLTSGTYRVVPATLKIDLSKVFLLGGNFELRLPLQFISCDVTRCASRTIVVPDFDVAFDTADVESKCRSGGGTFQERTEKLLFCQAAFRFLAKTGEGGSRFSDIALNGWYRAAHELHTNHQTMGVRAVGRDAVVEGFVGFRIDNGQYRDRVGITKDVFLRELAQLEAQEREVLQYLQRALRVQGGSSVDLDEWIIQIVELFARTATGPFPPSDADNTLLQAVLDFARH